MEGYQNIPLPYPNNTFTRRSDIPVIPVTNLLVYLRLFALVWNTGDLEPFLMDIAIKFYCSKPYLQTQ